MTNETQAPRRPMTTHERIAAYMADEFEGSEYRAVSPAQFSTEFGIPETRDGIFHFLALTDDGNAWAHVCATVDGRQIWTDEYLPASY